jgi:ferredoxin
VPRALAIASWSLWVLVFGLSAWNTFGGGLGAAYGVDASILYSITVWNVVWYATFVAIPYLGMSPCRTWGYCTTGTFVGLIGLRGRYRLEARDREVCRSCPTHDCGKACEVGLVDMPVDLARNGVYRNARCVGSHDCVAACPYGNLVSRDVRDDLRKLLGLPDRHSRPARAGSPSRPAPKLPAAVSRAGAEVAGVATVRTEPV